MLNLQYNDNTDPQYNDNNDPIRAAIYARVSSDSQDINNSIEAQIKECEEFAKRHNIVIVKIYIDEAESGLVSSRPQFQEMMGDTGAKDKPFDIILVWKFSRFSRDKFDNALYKNRLKKRGIRIISIKEPIDNSPAGQMMENMIESMDAFYSANLSQDVRRGQRQIALRGYYPGNYAPYGLKIVKVQEEGGNAFHNTFVPDPPHDAIVVRVFQEAAAGRSENEIRTGLIEDGIPAPKGGVWADSTIHQMLHNMHYAGYIVWGVSSKSGEPPVIAEGKHEGIISKELFEQANQVLASKWHEVVNPRSTASEYMLSGMLKCRLSGHNMRGLYSKNKKIRYYVCSARKDDGIAGCALPYLNVEKFDRQILEVITGDILCPENVSSMMVHIANELSGPYEEQANVLANIEAEIVKVQDQQNRIMTAYEAGVYTVQDFAKRMDPLRKAEADLLSKRAAAAQQLDHQAAIIANPQAVLDFAQDVVEFIKHSSPKERKQVLRKFVKTIWIEPGHAKVVYRLPLPKARQENHDSDEGPALEGEPVSPSTLLSPHTRGYSAPSDAVAPGKTVDPAHTGIDRKWHLGPGATSR